VRIGDEPACLKLLRSDELTELKRQNDSPMESAADDARILTRQLEDLRSRERALSRVNRAIARAEGLQLVLDEVVDAAKRLCDGDHAQLYLAEGDVFVVLSASGGAKAADEYAVRHPHARDRTSVIGRVALSGETVQIPDVLADAEYSYRAQEIVHYRALLGVPIVLDDQLIGAIAVGRDSPGLFADHHVELVERFADQAAIAIANARAFEAIERQRTELSRYLSPQVAELISSHDGEQLLAGHRAYITCLFCDFRGFTAFAETAAPEEHFEVLRAYHQLIGELLPVYSGTLEHFAGDGVMAFFNDPVTVPDHELQAIRFALAAQDRFGELAQSWQKRGIDLALGIGIEADHATLGRIGFEGRYDYGALGPVTSLASRLSTIAAGGQILIGQRVFAAVEDSLDASPVGELELKGFGRAIPPTKFMDFARGPAKVAALSPPRQRGITRAVKRHSRTLGQPSVVVRDRSTPAVHSPNAGGRLLRWACRRAIRRSYRGTVRSGGCRSRRRLSSRAGRERTRARARDRDWPDCASARAAGRSSARDRVVERDGRPTPRKAGRRGHRRHDRRLCDDDR
jgi:adenylate cyclase